MTVLERYDFIGFQAVRSAPPISSRIQAISSEAMFDSLRYILAELDASISSTSDLLSALIRFQQDGRTHCQCAKSVLADSGSCADIDPLFHGIIPAQSVLARLTTLKDILDDSTDEAWGMQTSGMSGFSFAMSLALNTAHGEALDAMVLTVSEVRRAMQPMQAGYTGA